MRKHPTTDKTLYDHIKELFTAWAKGEEFLLTEVTDFSGDFLVGYLAMYYKGDNTHLEAALEYFRGEIEDWETDGEGYPEIPEYVIE